MNASAFRHLYGYHFSENRIIWERYISQLSDAQFSQQVNYSYSSVAEQVVHLINADESWFSGLRGVEIPDWRTPTDFSDRAALRAHWDRVEQTMADYLAGLQDEMLFTKPLQEEDAGLFLWQVLLHVANHGTDHRAQLLRLLSDLGLKTLSQDYIFYVYDHPVDEA